MKYSAHAYHSYMHEIDSISTHYISSNALSHVILHLKTLWDMGSIMLCLVLLLLAYLMSCMVSILGQGANTVFYGPLMACGTYLWVNDSSNNQSELVESCLECVVCIQTYLIQLYWETSLFCMLKNTPL